jgi:small subunit ribosomal protein S15
MYNKEEFKLNANDTGSIAVQVVALTEKMGQLAQHCQHNPKDHSAKRGMVSLVNQRRSSLKYLQRKYPEQYKSLIAKLNLRK